jgi:hypothetical protein
MRALRARAKSVPPTTADHSERRETVGIVVVLLWNHGDLDDAVRLEVHDERNGARFVLHPATDEPRPGSFTTGRRWSVSDPPWRLDRSVM